MDAGLLPALSLGFLFGLQHATDADHVVAVATIVSRTRRFDAGALIGAFWGIGHTATIATVGMAIIVFNVTVTPAIGLTMELAVALMLMGLGIFRVVRAVRERSEAPRPRELGRPSRRTPRPGSRYRAATSRARLRLEPVAPPPSRTRS